MGSLLVTTQVAAKPRVCACGKKCEIPAGTMYAKTVLPPWVVILDDVDEDGHPIGSPSGKWETWSYLPEHYEPEWW